MPPLSHKAPDRVRDDGGRFRPPSIRPTAALSGRRGDRTIPPLSTRWGFAPLRGVFSLSTRWGLAPFRGVLFVIDPVESGSRSGVSRPALPGCVFRYRPGEVLRRFGGPGRRRRGMLFVIDPMGSCAAGVAGSGRTCPVCFPDPDAAAFGAGYAPFGSRRRPFYVIVMFSISGVYRRTLAGLQGVSGKKSVATFRPGGRGYSFGAAIRP